eukprot:9694208-Alexandrium_andersonii.AAC.1
MCVGTVETPGTNARTRLPRRPLLTPLSAPARFFVLGGLLSAVPTGCRGPTVFTAGRRVALVCQWWEPC